MQNDVRRAKFVDAAESLYKEKGVSTTSIADIADRVGVTRSLFYHYFDNKESITDAVIEKQVEEFIERIRAWSRSLHGKSVRESLVEFTHVARMALQGPASLGNRIVVEGDASLYQRFVVRSSQLLADLYVSVEGKPGSLIEISDVGHPRESFYVLSVGIMSTMIRQEQVSDEVLADVIADTLHIDLNYDGADRKYVYGQGGEESPRT